MNSKKIFSYKVYLKLLKKKKKITSDQLDYRLLSIITFESDHGIPFPN